MPSAGKKSSPYLYPSGRVPSGYRIPVPKLPSVESLCDAFEQCQSRGCCQPGPTNLITLSKETKYLIVLWMDILPTPEQPNHHGTLLIIDFNNKNMKPNQQSCVRVVQAYRYFDIVGAYLEP
jgi:hypothetical protein